MSDKTNIQTKTFFEQNQINQINQINGYKKRSNQSFHMKPEIARISREYAKSANIATGEFAEKAFLEYIENHPLNSKTFVIQQQIVSNVPSRQERIKILLLNREISFILERVDKVDDNIRKDLLMRLSKLLLKGANIKNAPDEFILLLEEGMKHII